MTGDIGGSPCTPLPENGAFGGGPGGILRDCPGISIIHLSLVFFGLLMNKKIGRYLRKRILIQFGIEWVRGPLKFQLMMTTVTRMETVFMMKVKTTNGFSWC